MKLNNIFATALMLGSMAAASAPATAQEADPWMHLYYKNTNGLLSFPMEEILQIGADSEEGNVIVTHADKGDIVLPWQCAEMVDWCQCAASGHYDRQLYL